MARRKTVERAENPEAPDVFDEQIARNQAAAQEQVHSLADATRMPEGNGHAEAPQQPAKKVYPPHRSWGHDNAAGVEMSTYANKEEKLFEARLQFRDGDPGQEVRQYMKENGFMWKPDREPGANFGKPGAWVHPVAYEGAADRLTAERVYYNVVEMMKEAKGQGQSR